MTSRVEIREGSAADADLLLAWFDEAVRWMVARGQTRQWGSAPFSSRPDGPERVSRLAGGGGLRIAELNREPVAALVVGCAPDYVSPADGRGAVHPQTPRSRLRRDPEAYASGTLTGRRFTAAVSPMRKR